MMCSKNDVIQNHCTLLFEILIPALFIKIIINFQPLLVRRQQRLKLISIFHFINFRLNKKTLLPFTVVYDLLLQKRYHTCKEDTTAIIPRPNQAEMNFRNLVCRMILFISFAIINCFLFSFSIAQNNRKYFTGDNTNEIVFNKISKSAQRATRDMENLPASFSIKQYAPVPGNQGKYGTCVAWSTAYAARTISYCIQHQVTDTGKIKAAAFSPNYLYYFIKTPGDNNCTMGAKIEPALKALTDTGDMLLSANIPDCVNIPAAGTYNTAKKYTIKAYSALTNTFGRITKNEVIAIKKCIAENKPVIFSVKYFSSLDSVGNDGVWKINPNGASTDNHAICIVGYDDNKLNGAFEVMNSWGTAWGNNGFFWITYDQLMQYGSYALELMDKEVYDANVTRDLGSPQLKGGLDFVLINDFGNELSPMTIVNTKIDVQGSPANDNNNAVFSDYRLSENYPGGTKFKIKFTTNAPAFVYIISIDDNKVVSTLFPYADNVSPAINSTNATIYLPSEEKHYTLNGDASRDRICVLYSKTAIDFENLKTQISKAPATFYETIMTMYKSRLIPLKNINFNDGQISFNSNAAEQEVICFFIDMNHK
jgi:C1A family cysteine protease